MDNQITSVQSKNSIRGMFAEVGASLNSLLHSSDKFMGTNLLVKVQNKEDYTVIPVNIVKSGKVSHEIESGIRTFCNHLEVTDNNCTECGDFVEQDCL